MGEEVKPTLDRPLTRRQFVKAVIGGGIAYGAAKILDKATGKVLSEKTNAALDAAGSAVRGGVEEGADLIKRGWEGSTFLQTYEVPQEAGRQMWESSLGDTTGLFENFTFRNIPYKVEAVSLTATTDEDGLINRINLKVGEGETGQTFSLGRFIGEFEDPESQYYGRKYVYFAPVNPATGEKDEAAWNIFANIENYVLSTGLQGMVETLPKQNHPHEFSTSALLSIARHDGTFLQLAEFEKTYNGKTGMLIKSGDQFYLTHVRGREGLRPFLQGGWQAKSTIPNDLFDTILLKK